MTTVAYIVAYLFARAEGKDDAQRISNGEKIDHAAEWTERAGMVGITCLSLYLISPWASILDLILSMVGCGALFASVHRFTLNKSRGLEVTYISPSNLYDSFFLKLADQDVQRGGVIAYTLEAIITIALWVLS